MLGVKAGRLLCAAGLLGLASCGGSGGSGTAGGNTGNAPAPTPAPAPSPTPTPVAATARVYAASATTGRLDFTDRRDVIGATAQGFLSRDGLYYPAYKNGLYYYVGAGANANPFTDLSGLFKSAGVVDHETSQSLILVAPDTVKMVTPVTALLYQPGTDAAKIKTQLGITGSLFAMVSNPDLANYDAISEAASGDAARVADAARMSAAIMRALALAVGLSAAQYDAQPAEAATSVQISQDLGYKVSECLRDGPAAFIFANDRMVDLLQCYLRLPANAAIPRFRPLTLQAAAHLINAYAAAVPVRLETANDRARWMLGLRGYLAPAVAYVMAADDDTTAQAALALTTQDILNETARYVDHYSYNATGFFNPGPDFLTLSSGAPVTIDFTALRQNDILYGVAENGGVIVSGALQSVAVPPANAAEATVTRDGDRLTIAPASGFRGVTYFDYVTRSSTSEERTARVYLRVR